MIRLIGLLVFSMFAETLLVVAAEPPPRSERAPFTEGKRGSPPAFMQTDWRPGYDVPTPWRARYFYYETKYKLTQTLYGPVLETYADGTASWIRRQFDFRFQADDPVCINWMWSADQLPSLNAPEITKKGDDFAIRLYIFGQSVSGGRYGFNYVWANDHPPETVWKSPYSDNKLMALRQGQNSTRKLIPESRNLVLDLEMATGERPLTIDSIAIMSDAEGSDSVAAARISEVVVGRCQTAIS